MNQEPKFTFESPDQSSGFLLWQVSNLWQRKMKAGLDKLQLTHVQFALLAGAFWLGRDNHTVTQIRLAEHARTDKMMTSKVLRTLETKGLITRSGHETDTRAKSIMVTEQGKTLLIKAVEIVNVTERQFFNHLDKDLDALNEALRTLINQNK